MLPPLIWTSSRAVGAAPLVQLRPVSQSEEPPPPVHTTTDGPVLQGFQPGTATGHRPAPMLVPVLPNPRAVETDFLSPAPGGERHCSVSPWRWSALQWGRQ